MDTPARRAVHSFAEEIRTAIIGIAGSLLATWIGQNVFGWYQEGQSAGFIASVIGAIVLLLMYHLVKRKSV